MATPYRATVEVYGTSFCRHCVAARELLERKEVVFIDYLIDLMPLEKDAMMRRCGIKKVPQIFINDAHIGSDEELIELELEGALDELLMAPPPAER